jgi:cytoskeleton protein RodZ
MLDDNEQGDAGAEQAPQSLGDMLRAARAAQELSLDQVAAELRIEERLLRALEEHRFEDLGAPVFAKGYLKQYAHRLNLSYNDLLSEYYRLADPRDVSIEPSRVIKLHDERQITVWIVAVLVLLLLGVALFVWWVSQPESSFPPPAVSSRTATSDLDLDLALPPTPAVVAGAGSGPTAAAVQPADAPVPPGLGTDAAASGLQPLEPAPVAALSQVAVPAPDETPGAASAALRVVVNFEQDSWAEITDRDGRRLFYGLGRAGGRSDLVGAAPIDVRLGNVEGVRLVVGNVPFAVPEAGRQGNVARFTIDPRD